MQQRMGGINGIVISKDLNCTVSVGQDKKIVFWDNDLKLVNSLSKASNVLHSHFLDGENDEGLTIAISNCGKFIATGGTAGVIRIWLYPSGSLFVSAQGHNAAILSLTFSVDDKQLVSAAADGAIILWYLNFEGYSMHNSVVSVAN